MRSTVRSFVLGAGVLLAAGASAQYPYWLYLNGTVSNCYPGQTVNVITVQGTQPAYDWDIPVDPNTCTWSVSLGLNTSPSWFQASTLCNGMVVNFTDQVNFNFQGDSAIINVTLDCGNSNPVDCNGMVNGPDMPGTPCDDGNPMTSGDLWTPACVCTGQDSSNVVDCTGIPGGQNLPGTFCINFFGDSGIWSVDCVCEMNTGVPDCLGNPGGGALPGSPCVYTPDSGNTYLTGTWSADCVCDGDTSGFIYDCLGVLNGTDLPGTFCVWNNQPGTWSADCVCNPDSGGVYDCLWLLNGPNMPGTACIVPGTIVEGTWSSACVCVPDSSGFLYDCNGVLNGPDMPGTPCDDSNPATTNDTWNSACVCVGNSNEPCNADFWVIQAMGSDSLPVPYELWVWNLSSGGSGNFTFNWNFGDGTSSTEAFPTHTYDGNGPYVLCLTIVDNNACTSTHCDSISINGDGIYEGMVVHAEDRQDGFTINVQNPNANAVQEVVPNTELALWPNPVMDELNVAVVSGMKGLVNVIITDPDGRTVSTERTSLGGGRSQLRISTSGLNAGMYMLRITDGSVNVSQRFVKTN